MTTTPLEKPPVSTAQKPEAKQLKVPDDEVIRRRLANIKDVRQKVAGQAASNIDVVDYLEKPKTAQTVVQTADLDRFDPPTRAKVKRLLNWRAAVKAGMSGGSETYLVYDQSLRNLEQIDEQLRGLGIDPKRL